MGRGGRTRRWIAASGGVLINGLILAALVLVEQTPPTMEEQPVITLELERPQRRRPREPHPATTPASAATPRSTVEAPASVAAPAAGDPAPSEPALIAPSAPIDPAWRVDPKVVDRWRLQEGNAAMGAGRVKRACLGLSNEHMTPEEKEACYAGWGGRRDNRPSPGFVGPIDERKWEVYRPAPKLPSVYDKDARRQERCRDYHRGRTPGFSERNLASTGSPPPSLSEKGCF